MFRRFRRFAGVSVVPTALDVAVFAGLAGAIGWSIAVADVVALGLASVASYLLHRHLTFRDDPYVRWVEQPAAFVGVALTAGLVDLAVVLTLAWLAGPGSVLAVALLKLPAVAVAGAFRLSGYRWLLLQGVRAEQHRRTDRQPPPGDQRMTVVIPALDEADRIADAVRRVRAELVDIASAGGVEIVVVDDGSTDGTAREAREAGADKVIVLDENRGKGAAVRAGMLAARGRTRAFTDADLAYSPAHLPRLLEEVESGWDVVVGSRRHLDATALVRARRLREIGGRVINLLTWVVLLGQYLDTQCGLKAFRSDIAELLFTEGRVDGFAFDVELFHLVERYRLSLREIPVDVAHSSRSTVRVARDGAGLVRDLFRVRRWAKAGRYRTAAEPEAPPPVEPGTTRPSR